MRKVRVVAVTQDDPFFTARFFETFLEASDFAVELLEVVLLPNFNESRAALLRRLTRFYGPLGVARLAARYGRARKDERRGVPRSVDAIAARRGVPSRLLTTINDPDYLSTLSGRSVDVLLSVAAPQVFRREALEAAPLVLNVHSGRLPEYRGMMPTVWALLDGADQVVVTVHEMAEQLDAGRVIAEFGVPVEPDASAFDVSRAAKGVAGASVAALLATLGTEDWPPGHEIDVTSGAYHGFPGRREARRLRAAGRRLL